VLVDMFKISDACVERMGVEFVYTFYANNVISKLLLYFIY
jgi:hypothetical protein